MGLPVVALPTSTLTIEGQELECRGLSRTEAMYFTTGFTESVMPDLQVGDRADLAEVYLIVKGTGVSDEEATQWRDVTDPTTVGLVVDEIIKLSGLAKDDEKDADPQSPTSAP